MGLTLIRKSDGTATGRQSDGRAGARRRGAISGGAFKVGGLKALNDFLVDRKITDLDLVRRPLGRRDPRLVARRRASAPTR